MPDKTNNNQYFDVIISGGGLSGALTALSLLSLKKCDGTSLSIAIIEANELTPKKLNEPSRVNNHATNVFDDRVLALSHASVDYLKALKLWPLLQSYAQPITDIHISDREYYGKARITAKEHNVAAVGYVIEMSILGSVLHQSLIQSAAQVQSSINAVTKSSNSSAAVTWFTPDSIEYIEWLPDSVNITLASEQKLSGALLVGCDGAHSICRKFANIACDVSEYGQSALITNVSTAQHHQGVAYERFTEHGPIAMLPMVDVAGEKSRCSLVWTLTPEQASEIKQLSDNEFKIALEEAFGSWLGEINQVGKRHVFPLSLVQAQEQVYHRMALMGNASHTIHPIAGQGFNLGLRDVQMLTQTLQKALSANEDIGAFHRLFEYAQSRKKDHAHIITLTDSLVTLFSNDLSPLVAGRNVGLKVLNYVPAIKNTFVHKAMGYSSY